MPAEVVNACRRSASGIQPILLFGPPGSGKSQAGSFICELQPSRATLQIVDCSVETPENVQHLLFDGEQTKEAGVKDGFLSSKKDALLIRHIHELDQHVQRQLARALNDREFRSPRSRERIQVDPEKLLIATTLDEPMREGGDTLQDHPPAQWAGILGSVLEGPQPHSGILRELLDQFPARIFIPPLCAHKVHIPQLLKSILSESRWSGRVSLLVIFLLQVMDYRRANARQLRNAVEQAIAKGHNSDILMPDHFGARILWTPSGTKALRRPWPERTWSIASEEERSRLPFRPVIDGKQILNWHFDAVDLEYLDRADYFESLLQLYRLDDRTSLDRFLAVRPLGAEAGFDNPNAEQKSGADPWYYTPGYKTLISPEQVEFRLNVSQRAIVSTLNNELGRGPAGWRDKMGLLNHEDVHGKYHHFNSVFQKGPARQLRDRIFEFGTKYRVRLRIRLLPYDQESA